MTTDQKPVIQLTPVKICHWLMFFFFVLEEVELVRYTLVTQYNFGKDTHHIVRSTDLICDFINGVCVFFFLINTRLCSYAPSFVCQRLVLNEK